MFKLLVISICCTQLETLDVVNGMTAVMSEVGTVFISVCQCVCLCNN